VCGRHVELKGNSLCKEINPITEAQECLEAIVENCRSRPGFDLLLAGTEGAKDFVFPTGYAAFLPNGSQSELVGHPLGDLTETFSSSRTMTRDVFLPWWENKDLSPKEVEAAICAYMARRQMTVPLTAGQVRVLRAVIHLEIRLADRPMSKPRARGIPPQVPFPG
jgi:hypothetical protein